MFCIKCGKQIDDDSTFCPFCGAPVEKETPKPKTKAKAPKPKTEPAPAKPKTKKAEPIKEEPVIENTQPINYNNPKPNSKKGLIIGIISAAVVILGVLGYFFFFSGTAISVLGDIEYEIEGYNGYGHLSLNDGNSAFGYIVEHELDNLENAALTCAFQNQSNGGCQNILQRYNYLEAAINSLEDNYEVTDNKSLSELSNGDKVTIVVTYNKEAFKRAGYKLKDTKKTITIQGLPEPQEIDVSQYMDFKWVNEGDSFSLKSDVKEGCPVSEIPCEISDPDSDGNVTVTVDANELGSDGYKPSKPTFTVNVGPAPKVLNKLTDENKEAVYELATFVLNDTFANKCGSNVYLKGGAETLIYSQPDDITSLSVSNGRVKATFKVATENGSQFTKSIAFDAYIDQDGNYVCSTEFDIENLGCSIVNGQWLEYEPEY